MTNSGQSDARLQPRLEKSRHIRYWTRCLKTFLPYQYTSNDSNRMYLAFFILAALDLLDALETLPSEDERRDHIDWVYRCQHPDGGFRMWPGTDFGERRNETNAIWDPASVPATYFALSILLIYKDDFKRIKRRETLRWVQQMQRPDGSFGETLINGRIEGGRDPRFGYCAAGIRYILRGDTQGSLSFDGQKIQDIDIDGLVRCIRAAESLEGGIADEPLHEPHAGYTFCSIGALAFVDRLHSSDSAGATPIRAPCSPYNVLKWLVSRQTELIDPESSLDTEFSGKKALEGQPAGQVIQPAFHGSQSSAASSTPEFLVECAGMNGRTNKVADTCYAFWSAAPLHIMNHPTLYNHYAVREYLLGKTQHPVLGGFGKFPGDLPDLYHSYLGLAALSLAGGKDIKELDSGMCLSKEARERLPALWESWKLSI